ncbi:pseudouridine synthase [Putridiphycobacter roseus]|uniref:tRNA pseudouridine synthase C n=1 Tax=Putridiphycobacter roseus TaxID=2219161 RepID=A0A2W1N060_9FLAO|nr:pseudouridine synthase [Putridiphycobacter roseus]PZE17587.1 pseudouridine synthase [Putridiphycobacter roseus]
MEIGTVFEDAWFKIINKPSNLIVHHSNYARNLDEVSLCQWVNKEAGKSLHPIHRLDRKTSGLIIFAKDKTVIPKMQTLFAEHKITKQYVALVRGFVTEAGSIDSPIRADEAIEYKEAFTAYKPLHSFEVPIPVQPYDAARYTILSLKPTTGRMHQLRKHMNKFSHPIIGDPKYGNRHHNHMFIEKFACSNLFLHAKTLSFIHPITERPLVINAKFPAFWENVFTHLNCEFPLKNC